MSTDNACLSGDCMECSTCLRADRDEWRALAAKWRELAEKAEAERDLARQHGIDTTNAAHAEAQRFQTLAIEREAQVAVLREALRGVLDALGEAVSEDDISVHDFDSGGAYARALREVRAQHAARAALASTPAPEHDYSGLCAAPSCEGHCGYVHARGCEAVREYLADHGGKPYRAPSPPDILRRVAERAMWLTAERLGERLNEVEGVRYTMANIDGTAIDTAAIIKEATRG